MQVKTLKTSDELRQALNNVDAELIIKDKTVVGARVGEVIFRTDSYAFSATCEVPYEEAKRIRVTVTHPNFDPIIRYFETDYEAQEFLRSYEDFDNTEMEKIEVTVKLDENAQVVS